MFEEFVGQKRLINELSAIVIGLQKNSQESLNIILRGPAGCGKTTLAETFCEEISGTYGYQIPRKYFTMKGIEIYRCQIVDEIHVVKQFEDIYPWMDCGKYIFVFCTTEFGNLPDPFVSRCIQLNFDDYSEEEITTIVYNYGEKLGISLTRETSKLIAKRSRGKPRIAKNYVKRMKFIIARGYYPFTVRGVNAAFNDIGVFNGGYTDLDMKYLRFLEKVKQASLRTISRSIGVDENTIKNEIEPFLTGKHHIEITSRGRKFVKWEGEENVW